jgi:hypothetical protein
LGHTIAIILLGLSLNVQSLTAPQAAAKAKKPVHSRKPHHLVVVKPKPILDTAYYFTRFAIDSCDSNVAIERSLIREINRWSGVRYRKAGMTVRGIDCSGFVKSVYQRALSITLPRTSRLQFFTGEKIHSRELQFGDLVFFQTRRHQINHVGIYLSDGQFVHSHRHGGVAVDSLTNKYYAKRFAAARRVLSLQQEFSYAP